MFVSAATLEEAIRSQAEDTGRLSRMITATLQRWLSQFSTGRSTLHWGLHSVSHHLILLRRTHNYATDLCMALVMVQI